MVERSKASDIGQGWNSSVRPLTPGPGLCPFPPPPPPHLTPILTPLSWAAPIWPTPFDPTLVRCHPAPRAWTLMPVRLAANLHCLPQPQSSHPLVTKPHPSKALSSRITKILSPLQGQRGPDLTACPGSFVYLWMTASDWLHSMCKHLALCMHTLTFPSLNMQTDENFMLFGGRGQSGILSSI